MERKKENHKGDIMFLNSHIRSLRCALVEVCPGVRAEASPLGAGQSWKGLGAGPFAAGGGCVRKAQRPALPRARVVREKTAQPSWALRPPWTEDQLRQALVPT